MKVYVHVCGKVEKSSTRTEIECQDAVKWAELEPGMETDKKSLETTKFDI